VAKLVIELSAVAQAQGFHRTTKMTRFPARAAAGAPVLPFKEIVRSIETQFESQPWLRRPYNEIRMADKGIAIVVMTKSLLVSNFLLNRRGYQTRRILAAVPSFTRRHVPLGSKVEEKIYSLKWVRSWRLCPVLAHMLSLVELLLQCLSALFQALLEVLALVELCLLV
jgi:hypothetical protein